MLAALALGGCSAPGPVPEPPSTPAVSAAPVPAGGVSLAQLGFQHGPASALTLPAEVRIGLRVDQPNMVTMTFVAPEGPVIGDWLRTHVGEGGFRVTADAAGGLVFEGYAWEGAFTVGEQGSALTLRREPRVVG